MTTHPDGPVPVLLKEQSHIEGWLATEANKFKVAEWCCVYDLENHRLL